MSSLVAFYIISAFILGGALLAVTSAKIFRSAVWLLFALTGIASLYFLMDLQFLAAVQIIVYIGGIAVLIIFSIFLTAYTNADMAPSSLSRKLVAALVSIAGFIIVSTLVLSGTFTVSAGILNSDVSVIGRNMLNTGHGGFALPFEAISILLLSAMIGCIAIAIRKNPEKL